MKKVNITRLNGSNASAQFATEEQANDWIAQGVAANWWGLPERTVVVDSEPYTEDDILESIPAVMDGDEQLEPPMVKLRAQYTIEIEDLGNSLVLADLRSQRNLLLSQTDWTQVNDAPLSTEQKAAYASYRQALRDLPSNNTNVASLDEVQFPSKPE